MSKLVEDGKIPPHRDTSGTMNYQVLFQLVDEAMTDVKAKLSGIKSAGSSVSIANMFDLQMLMNRLSQYSEATTAIMAGMHGAITSMARNIK